MERKPDESFEDYKVRRSISNNIRKNINRLARSGGGLNARAQRPSRKGIGIRGIANTNFSQYGANLAASFASFRLTPAFMQRHVDYLDKVKARRQARAAQVAA